MPNLKVNIKWGRENYKDIDVNTDEDPTLFKAQVYALTGVHPSRQKLMVKGKTLGDAPESWSNFPVNSGSTILLMGSKEEDIIRAPTESVKFVEDMDESELATALEMPMGLVNLGNTCYLNATVQCLKTVPPLVEQLKTFVGSSSATDSPIAITAALRDLYSTMDKKLNVPPLFLLQALHTAFPRFAERGEGGVWAQQDANELWTELVRMLQQKLPPNAEGVVAKYKSIIDQYFGLKLAVEWKNNEEPNEPVSKSTEDFLQLSCFIAPETRYMHAGLLNKLEETITKNSPTLGRDAEYTKKGRVDRLPAYLTIQMVRFFYKQQGVNAKILKDVKFPMILDVFDLCTKRLQEKLIPMRNKFKELEDAVAEGKIKLKDDDKDKTKPKITTTPVPYEFKDDPGSNNSGFYELQAVLTHKGRSSSSGHYVGWIKHKEDVWLMCDDDNVSPVHAEDVLKLSGGGDWHTAYVLIYGPKVLELPQGQTMEPVYCFDTNEESMALTTTSTESEPPAGPSSSD